MDPDQNIRKISRTSTYDKALKEAIVHHAKGKFSRPCVYDALVYFLKVREYGVWHTADCLNVSDTTIKRWIKACEITWRKKGMRERYEACWGYRINPPKEKP